MSWHPDVAITFSVGTLKTLTHGRAYSTLLGSTVLEWRDGGRNQEKKERKTKGGRRQAGNSPRWERKGKSKDDATSCYILYIASLLLLF